jgi:hypothetical protein
MTKTRTAAKRDRLRTQAEETLLGLTLSTKPVSEATFMKGLALMLAASHAQAKMIGEIIRGNGADGWYDGALDPDRFLGFVIAYCLKSESCEEMGLPTPKSKGKPGAKSNSVQTFVHDTGL